MIYNPLMHCNHCGKLRTMLQGMKEDKNEE